MKLYIREILIINSRRKNTGNNNSVEKSRMISIMFLVQVGSSASDFAFELGEVVRFEPLELDVPIESGHKDTARLEIGLLERD